MQVSSVFRPMVRLCGHKTAETGDIYQPPLGDFFCVGMAVAPTTGCALTCYRCFLEKSGLLFASKSAI